jgi:hypothetical protein
MPQLISTLTHLFASLSDLSSGATYSNDTGEGLHVSVTVTLNPTALAGSSAIMEYLPGGPSLPPGYTGSWTEYCRAETPSGITLAATRQQLFIRIPSGYQFRVTCTNASIFEYAAIGSAN